MSDGDLLIKILLLVNTLAAAVTGFAVLTGRGQKREVTGEVSEKKEFVDRASYHKHAELNRESHAALERRIERVERVQAEAVCEIKQDVARLLEVREQNGERLSVLEKKLGEVSDTLHEQAGSLHQIAKQAGNKRS